MGLFGALSSSVSGINAQGTAIGVTSDNISNINTIGYKSASPSFSTLVTSAVASTGYSSGGVESDAHQLIDQQGLIQGTGVTTDLAISGDGFFVVKDEAGPDGETFYTRAGAFRQDADGNFINSAGFLLMAWPLDSEGRLPGQLGNLDTTSTALLESLDEVNISTVSGTAGATTQVDIGLNLDAAEDVYRGPGDTVDFLSTSTENNAIGSADIIAPEPASNSGLVKGNNLTIQAGGASFTYTYDGFEEGYRVTGGIFGSSSASQVFVGPTNSTTFTVATATSGTVTYTYVPSSPNVANGQFNSMATLADAIDQTAGLSARIADNRLLVAPDDANEAMTFVNTAGTLGTSNDLATTNAFGAALTATAFDNTATDGDGLTVTVTGLGVSNDISASTAYGANAIADPFLVASGATNGDGITITTSSGIAETFLFDDGGGADFTSLATLAAAINASANFTAAADANVANRIIITPATGKVVDISSRNLVGTSNFAESLGLKDARSLSETYVFDATPAGAQFNSLDTLAASITANSSFLTGTTAGANEDIVIGSIFGDVSLIVDSNVNGTSNIATTLGLTGQNYLAAFGLDDTTAGTDRFASLEGLSDLINTTNEIAAVIESPLANAELDIYATDPLGTITFSEPAVSNVVPYYSGSILTEFGLVDTPATYTQGVDNIGPLGPSYDATGTSANNMAGGSVTPHFSRNVRVFDALGTGHDFQMSFLKIADNSWAAEVYAIDPDGILSTRTDGQITKGTIVFNGDGSLRSISPELTQPIEISWSNGAIASNVTFDYGTAGQPAGTVGATSIGLTDGIRQFDTDYDVRFVDQNGVSAGLLSSILVDEDGFVVANFSNGESRKIFKVPLADFVNPNGLQTQGGNVFKETKDSGEFNLREAGTGGVGAISPASLEGANVELADELTDMIIAQRAYQASSKVISTVDELLEELNRSF